MPTMHAFFDPLGAFAPRAAARWQRRGLHAGRRADAKRILVTGATGFIGTQLVERLIERGDRVLVLARNAAKAEDRFGPHATVVGDLTAISAETRIDAIVNLAGESIAGGPWTRRRRELLLASRLGVTAALVALVDRLAVKPRTWVNASAIGYYGARKGDDPWKSPKGDDPWKSPKGDDPWKSPQGDEPLHERTAAGSGFQSELCRRWEEAALGAAAHGVKVAALRFGVVLGRDGGALPALARPVRLFAGTGIGSGRQWFSWIHVDDLVNAVLFVLDQETLAGPLNATAPEPVRHAELMTAMAAKLRRPLWPVRIPAWLLRACLGELAELFVDGQRVVPERLLALKFEFRYPTIDAALEQALAPRSRAGTTPGSPRRGTTPGSPRRGTKIGAAP